MSAQIETAQVSQFSSAVRCVRLAIRQSATRVAPRNTPTTVWVLPTSIASSIGLHVQDCDVAGEHHTFFAVGFHDEAAVFADSPDSASED